MNASTVLGRFKVNDASFIKLYFVLDVTLFGKRKSRVTIITSGVNFAPFLPVCL